MREGWKAYKLGDLGTFFGGVTSVKPHDYGYGTPFLTYKNVFKNSKVDVNELELMNVKPQDIQKRSAIYGDIFFTASSETPDEVAMSSVLLDNVPDLTYNGFCKRFRLNDFRTLMPEFARYLFRGKSFRESVCQVATGDIRFNISQESLGNISVDLPSLAEQKHIAQILGSLDDKIELNRRLNDNLEQQAQAIFKSWFVDFDPFRGDGLVGSELGIIPKGWRVGLLGDLVHVRYGKDHKKLLDGSIPVYGSGGIMRYANQALYDKESILIPRKGTLNNVFYIDEPFWSVDTMFFTEMKCANVAKYIYFFLVSRDLASMNAGSAVPSMTTEILNNLRIVIPSEKCI